MAVLKAIKPKQTPPKKPKILIYGKPGVGKTWVSLDFPTAYFIDTEGGATLAHYQEKLEKSGGVYLGVSEGSTDFPTVLEQVKTLATQKHHYKTLVIDSITKIFALAIAGEIERLGKDDVFGKSKVLPVSYMRRLVNYLTTLDMTVILIAHEKTEWGMVNGQRAEIGNTFDCWEKLEYELDLVLQILKDGSVRAAKVKKSRLSGFHDGKGLAWSYKDFAELYGKDIIESEPVPIVIASEAQLKELEHLFSIVKLPADFEEKCLKKLNVDCWRDAETNGVQKAIDYIKTNFINQTKGE
jgi:hypothetical protein